MNIQEVVSAHEQSNAVSRSDSLVEVILRTVGHIG